MQKGVFGYTVWLVQSNLIKLTLKLGTHVEHYKQLVCVYVKANRVEQLIALGILCIFKIATLYKIALSCPRDI